MYSPVNYVGHADLMKEAVLLYKGKNLCKTYLAAPRETCQFCLAVIFLCHLLKYK